MHSYATPYAHRDIKPHNILLNPRAPSAAQGDGARFTAVLMDFGSAKPAHIVVMNRNAALAVQEEAEVCTDMVENSDNIEADTGAMHGGVQGPRAV